MSSLAVSGAAKHPKVQFDKAADTTLLVTIEGVEEAGNEEDVRGPVDLVVVLDQSGSMSGPPIQLCKETCQFIAKELTSNDRMALVSFDSTIHERMRLTVMDPAGQSLANKKIAEINAGSCTNLSGGLFKGIDLLRDPDAPIPVAKPSSGEPVAAPHPSTAQAEECSGDVPMASEVPVGAVHGEAGAKPKPTDRTRAVLVLTDGFANEGVSNAAALVSLTKQLLAAVGDDVRIYTFGYGTNHSADLLEQLAVAGNGTYFFVNKLDDVAGAFGDCLGGLTSMAAQSIKLTITGAGGATLAEAPMTKFVSRPVQGGFEIEIPDIVRGEKKNVLIKASLPALTASLVSGEKAPVAIAHVRFVDCGSFTLSEASIMVFVERPGQVTDKEMTDSCDDQVVLQELRYEAAKSMEAAKLEADAGRLKEGQQILFRARENVTKMRKQSEMLHQNSMLLCLDSDLMGSAAGMSSSMLWRTSGEKMHRNNTYEYTYERSSKAADTDASAFRTRQQVSKRAASKTFVGRPSVPGAAGGTATENVNASNVSAAQAPVAAPKPDDAARRASKSSWFSWTSNSSN